MPMQKTLAVVKSSWRWVFLKAGSTEESCAKKQATEEKHLKQRAVLAGNKTAAPDKRDNPFSPHTQ